ncbi:MAG TPA: alpha/beta fold hydrolase [Stellaceae bacterium]|nr:alpha/beta fold hydrolase [Stellaceae bacterium]
MDARSIFADACSRLLGGLALLALVVCVGGGARAETQFFSLYDFQLEDGTVMPELRIAYETQGKLSPARDNAIVLLHDALEDHHAFDVMIGPGKTFDTNRYFVIAADAIGGGESAAPGDGAGQDFPRYTIRDMMAAEYGLVSRGLGLTRLRAVIGRSMGAFIALEWAVQHPEMPRVVVVLAPAVRADANFQVVIDAMAAAVALDPAWEGGRYKSNPVEGLRHAGIVYFPWAVSTAYLDRLAPEAVAQESEAAAKNFAQWDANGLVLRLAACRGYDLSAPFDGDLDAALARMTMPVLLLPSASDRLIGHAGAQRLRTALAHASYAEISTNLGHNAIASPPGTTEGDFIDRTIRGFLAGPK